MLTLLEAIAKQEGFYVSGTLANRRCNPGNIDEGRFAQTHGALPPDGNRFAAWPTSEAGFAAMRALLTDDYLGLTLAAALDKWAPPIENDVNSYLADVVKWTGMEANEVLTQQNIG